MCSLEVPSLNTRGPGYWKMNNQHFQNSDFCKGVVDTIANTLKNCSNKMPKRDSWELIKYNIRTYSIHFGKLASNNNRTNIAHLQKTLDDLNSKIFHNTQNRNNLSLQKKKIEAEINSYYEQKEKGDYIRSRAKWITEGEIGSKYFLGLEKKRQNDNVIKKLKTLDNRTVFCDSDILKETHKFYTDLYCTKGTRSKDIDQYLSNIHASYTLSKAEKISCDKN